jgi:peptide chain release factor subunit 3
MPRRNADAPLRIPILDKIKDAGKLFIQGKVESGTVRLGQKIMLMPGKKSGKVTFLGTDLKEIKVAKPGENIRICVSSINDEHIRTGFVLCDEDKPITPVPQFECQMAIIDLLPHKPIISPGYSAVFHCHTIVEECSIKLLLSENDRKTGAVIKKKPTFVKKNAMVSCRIEVLQPVCIETFKDFPQLGRFTLRDEGKTIAVGTVTRLPQARKPGEGSEKAGSEKASA